jgi:hypothetical protein
MNGHLNIIDVLLAAGASLLITNRYGRTAQVVAQGMGHEHIKQSLLAATEKQKLSQPASAASSSPSASDATASAAAPSASSSTASAASVAGATAAPTAATPAPHASFSPLAESTRLAQSILKSQG